MHKVILSGFMLIYNPNPCMAHLALRLMRRFLVLVSRADSWIRPHNATLRVGPWLGLARLMPALLLDSPPGCVSTARRCWANRLLMQHGVPGRDDPERRTAPTSLRFGSGAGLEASWGSLGRQPSLSPAWDGPVSFSFWERRDPLLVTTISVLRRRKYALFCVFCLRVEQRHGILTHGAAGIVGRHARLPAC